MPYLFVGLGNPGEKYKNTRHNAGQLALEFLQKQKDFSPWRKERKAKGLLSEGLLSNDDVTLLFPETFMNNSGKSVKAFIPNKKMAEHMVVVHDEIDMPLGEMEIAYGKGSGGHNGVQSIIDDIGTKNFIRVRIGVSPVNWFGNIKKPEGKNAVTNFLLSDFKGREKDKLEGIFPKIAKALEMIVSDGRNKAMNEFNGEE